MTRCDIMLAGIGGQGIITLGTILKLAALDEGLEVVGSERRGGAQREGPVTSFVRCYKAEPGATGERDQLGSMIPCGSADMLISLEPVEAARYAAYLNADSVVLSNSFPLYPVAVRLGTATYPKVEELEANLRAITPHTYFFNMDEISRAHFGSPRQANIICMGLAAGLGRMPFAPETVFKFIRREFRRADPNILRRGFDLGVKLAGEAGTPNHT